MLINELHSTNFGNNHPGYTSHFCKCCHNLTFAFWAKTVADANRNIHSGLLLYSPLSFKLVFRYLVGNTGFFKAFPSRLYKLDLESGSFSVCWSMLCQHNIET